MGKSWQADYDAAYWLGYSHYLQNTTAHACPFEYGTIMRHEYIKGHTDARNGE